MEKNKKIQEITVTMQEIWQQTTPKVHKNKKKYTRKDKHKKNPDRQNPDFFYINSFAFSNALSNPLTSFPPAVAKKS